MSQAKLSQNLQYTSPNRAQSSRTLLLSPPFPSPVHNPNPTPKVSKLGSQNLGTTGNYSPSKRDLLISVSDATSPSKSSFRTSKKSLDLFTTALEGGRHSKRPSMSSNRYADISTRAGTMASLSKFTIKTLQQTPQSLTSLPSETPCVNQISDKETKTNNTSTIRSLNDVGTQRSSGTCTVKSKNSQMFSSRDEGFGDLLGFRQASVSLMNGGTEQLGMITEGNLTHRSSRKEKELSNFGERDTLLLKRREQKAKHTFERVNRTKKIGKVLTEESKETNKDTASLDNDTHDDKKQEKGKQDKKTMLKLVKREPSKPKRKDTFEEDKKRSNGITPLCIHLPSENSTPQELICDKKIKERGPLGVEVDSAEEKTPEGGESKSERVKFGRKGMLIKRLEGNRTQGPKSGRNEEASAGRKKDDSNSGKEQMEVRSKNNLDEGPKMKKPAFRRLKSEVQGPRGMLELDIDENRYMIRRQESQVEGTKRHPLYSEERNRKSEDNYEIFNEKPARNDTSINNKENLSVKNETKRKQVEEWGKVKRRDDGEEGGDYLKANVKTSEDIWRRNLWDDNGEEKEIDPKNELFKQGGRGFFELNLESKFLQKYEILRTLEENIIGGFGENLCERIRTDGMWEQKESENAQNESKNIQRTLPSELGSRSKSDKQVKMDPSTMMIRYYDELNPLVIQPKFMETTGSMCVTELWGNKNKKNFYKVMRKPFQSNTILSLNPQPGVYRPEKPINTSAHMRYKQFITGRNLGRENETGTVESPGFNENTCLVHSTRKGRHTRAFVLQQPPELRPKTSMFNKGFSGKGFF